MPFAANDSQRGGRVCPHPRLLGCAPPAPVALFFHSSSMHSAGGCSSMPNAAKHLLLLVLVAHEPLIALHIAHLGRRLDLGSDRNGRAQAASLLAEPPPARHLERVWIGST